MAVRSHAADYPELAAVRTWTGPAKGDNGVIRLTFNHADIPSSFREELMSALAALWEQLSQAIRSLINELAELLHSLL